MYFNWRPIYKKSSLPYNEGEEFIARYNNCFCETEEVNIKKCLKTRPCIIKFKCINDLSFTDMLNINHHWSKEAINANFKYWKFIQPKGNKPEDLNCCEIIKRLEEIFRPEPYITNVRKDFESYFKELKIQCSQHCGKIK